jgi:hypothetical protein
MMLVQQLCQYWRKTKVEHELAQSAYLEKMFRLVSARHVIVSQGRVTIGCRDDRDNNILIYNDVKSGEHVLRVREPP